MDAMFPKASERYRILHADSEMTKEFYCPNMMVLRLVVALSILFFGPSTLRGQSWTGTIDPSRAIDWSSAGVVGGIPSNSWTQCGATIEAYSGPAAAINTAIAACPSGHFVSLGSGTFNLSTSIDFTFHSNVALRGQGADSTLVVFTGSSTNFGEQAQVFLLANSTNYIGGEQNVCDWTGGYTPGSTIITLSNCGSTTPRAGALSSLFVGDIITLDQLDEATDTGAVWNCLLQGSCSNGGTGGAARIDGTCNGGMCNRSQQQLVTVTAINGSNISITPAIRMPNWNSGGQKPQASYPSTILQKSGIENLSLDFSNDGQPGGYGIWIMNCSSCWVSGVRAIGAGRSHVSIESSVHATVQSSYFYQNQSHASRSYGIERFTSSDSLVQNNILQQETEPLVNNGGGSGEVNGYNFAIDTVYASPGWMIPGINTHGAGGSFFLDEGNIANGYMADNVHGTHHFQTTFRNQFTGNQAAGCDGAPCSAQTAPIHLYASDRYFNVIGNVLGQSGYHNKYNCPSSSNSANCYTYIYIMGWTGNNGQADASIAGFCQSPACSQFGDSDPQTQTYLFVWGNYDTVTGAVRWCGNSSNPGWGTICGGNSEVPTSIAAYSNSVPASTDLPDSFYLSAKPAWFGNNPYPPIGPDVAGGNISGLGGHANMNPAMACFINTMKGPPDGSGGVLSFNASACYGGSVTTQGPAPPTSLNATVQ
jgi:hypothetical protein